MADNFREFLDKCDASAFEAECCAKALGIVLEKLRVASTKERAELMPTARFLADEVRGRGGSLATAFTEYVAQERAAREVDQAQEATNG